MYDLRFFVFHGVYLHNLEIYVETFYLTLFINICHLMAFSSNCSQELLQLKVCLLLNFLHKQNFSYSIVYHIKARQLKKT